MHEPALMRWSMKTERGAACGWRTQCRQDRDQAEDQSSGCNQDWTAHGHRLFAAFKTLRDAADYSEATEGSATATGNSASRINSSKISQQMKAE
jgi:hypothetical protein